MLEEKYDQALKIKTSGIREWRNDKNGYNRYEATPYEALEKLFENYTIEADDKLVDFGAGRGRVSFYVHNRFNIPVSGVENNDKTFDEALQNEQTYLKGRRKDDASLYFEFGLAENYEIQADDNLFFFFNPCSVKIFKKVIHNITKSIKLNDRQVDVILYYPLTEFEHAMKQTPFRLMNKIDVPGIHGKYGKFYVYRFG